MKSHLCALAALLLLPLAYAEDKNTAPEAAKPTDAAKPAPDLPLAKVGDSVITAEEFGRFARFRLRRISMETGKKVEADGKFRTLAMSELIASRMLEALAKEAKIEVAEADVAKDFEESRKAFKTPEEYQQYLQSQDLTEEELRAEVRRKILINKFVESKAKDVTVTPEEVQQKYDELKAKGAMNRDAKTVDLTQIVALFVGGDAESEKAARERVSAARARIIAGEKFEVVGEEVSKDPNASMQMGNIDEARPASLFPDIAKAVEALKPGEVSDIIKTPRGYGIVTARGWYEPGVVPLEKVKSKIETQMRLAKQNELVAAVVKEAKGRIPVEMYKADGSEVPAAAKPDATAAPKADAKPEEKPAADAPAGLLPPSDLLQTQ